MILTTNGDLLGPPTGPLEAMLFPQLVFNEQNMDQVKEQSRQNQFLEKWRDIPHEGRQPNLQDWLNAMRALALILELFGSLLPTFNLTTLAKELPKSY